TGSHTRGERPGYRHDLLGQRDCLPRAVTAERPITSPLKLIASTRTNFPRFPSLIAVSRLAQGLVPTAFRCFADGPVSTRQRAMLVAPFQLAHTVAPLSVFRLAIAGRNFGMPYHSALRARYELVGVSRKVASKATSPVGVISLIR